MSDIRQIFESDYCGIDTFLTQILSPIFGDYEKGYDVLTADKDIKEKAKQANILEIKHEATFDFFGNELKIFDITVGDEKKLENNRVGIQSIVRQYIAQFEGALIVFHHQNVHNQEWRLSYVEKRTNAKDSTSAKRYTYILGNGHPAKTITDNFKNLANDRDILTISDLTNAFSVAPLSNEFFDEYREHYARFVKRGGKFVEEKTKNANGAFKDAFGGDDKLVRDYVKKMMGRLVFLHFLQKKGWLGVPQNAEWGNGDKNFIYNLFNKASEDVKKDFLEQALEPLFFKTLNIDRGEDAIAPKAICDIYGRKIRIPYLNGGLFEEDELDKKKVKFKKEHFEALLTFFSQYNFTIDETDPDDQEIGVDPEMLGKIFENLLEDNKDKGAFYTPKEIVQYMCRESLIAYLENRTEKSEEWYCHSELDSESQIRNFVLNHDASSFSEGEKATILNALLNVKVCDPAVGSGAFPMGMLNELLACTQLLTGKTKTRAELKKHIVKNNIYGVDIEKGAVDIARLRFWLAIIVDEETPIPLPNLDYKIMQGNSLLECYDGIDFSKMLEKPENGEFDYNEEQRNLLKNNMDEYFDDNNHEDKSNKNDVIKALVYDLVCATCGITGNSQKALDMHEKIWDGTTDFFLWHTWFSDVFNRPNDCNSTGGFDIVIGNPPYGAKTSDKEKKLYKKYYEAAKSYKGVSKGSTDTFAVFVNLGYNLLSKNGNLAFIIPMAVTSSDAMTTLHNLFEKNCETIKVSSYSNRPKQIFDAACIRTSVFFFTKTLTPNKHIYTTKLQRRRHIDSIGAIIDGLIYIDSKELKLTGRYAKVSLPIEKTILTKLFATGKNIASYADENGKPFYYRTSGGRYFNVISDVPTGSNKDKPYFVRKDLNSVVGAILSTSLFWFYCQVYTNGLDLKTPELTAFPLPDFAELSSATISAINAKYAEYLADIEKNVIHHSTFKEYKLRKSKRLIDQLDDLICPLYGLSTEETEFIKNYEIEFRVEDEE